MRVNIVLGTEDRNWILWDMARYIRDYNGDMEIEISVDPIEGYDVYHINNDEMYDRPDIPWHRALYTCHQFERDNYRRTFWARKDAIFAARRIGCVNQGYMGMLNKFNVPTEKLYYTPGGVDTNKFFVNKDRIWQNGDKLNIGYIGRKYESGRKGEELLKEILMLLPVDRVKIVFVGDKREEEVEFCQQLNIECQYYQRGKNIEYDNYPSVYDEMDCVLVTSREEGGPICVLEALACGLPVITTPTGVAKDVYRENNCTFYTQAIDAVNSITQQIEYNDKQSQELDEDEWSEQYFAKKNMIRQSILGLPYTWERWAQIHREIYEGIHEEVKDKILIEDYMPSEQMEQVSAKYSEMAKQQIDPNHLENFLSIQDQAKKGQGILGTRNALKNKPTIIVGFGPSLDNHLDLLKNYQDNFAIISCDAAFPTLYNYGINPDIIFVGDWTAKQAYNFRENGEENGNHIDTTDYNVVIPSIVHPKTLEEINKSPNTHVFWYNVYDPGTKLMELIPNSIGKKGGIVAGVLTTGMAYSFAMGMGCSPIVFLGHDLSYPVDEKGIMQGYSKHASKSKDEYQKRSKFKMDLMSFPDINGNMIITHLTFVSFYNWINYTIKVKPQHVINGTEQGILHGEHIEQMKFSEICNEYGEENIAAEKNDKLNAAWYFDTVEELI